MRTRNNITQERVKELFDYRDDGNLVRRVKCGNANKGDLVKSKHNEGYLMAQIDGVTYRAHRLVWLWHHGYMPENGLDHINGKRDDNRIENLREFSQGCNRRNSRLYTRNKSGVKGVHYCTVSRKWKAQMQIEYRKFVIGRFDTMTAAVFARVLGEIETEWFKSDSTFSGMDWLVEKFGFNKTKAMIEWLICIREKKDIFRLETKPV